MFLIYFHFVSLNERCRIGP